MLCLSCVMGMHVFITFKQLLKTYRRITRDILYISKPILYFTRTLKGRMDACGRL